MKKAILSGVLALFLTGNVIAAPTGSQGGTGNSGSSDKDVAIGAAVLVGAGLVYYYRKAIKRKFRSASQVGANPVVSRPVKNVASKARHCHKANRLTKGKCHIYSTSKKYHVHRYHK